MRGQELQVAKRAREMTFRIGVIILVMVPVKNREDNSI